MFKNTYAVTAQFDTPVKRRVESWIGQARNMRMAMRAATSAIMTRHGVKRFRHQRVTFFIEKVQPPSTEKK